MSLLYRATARRSLLAVIGVTAMVAAACASDDDAAGPEPGGRSSVSQETFTIGAIPDQDPEKLQRLYGTVATYLSGQLGVKVEYKPVTDYPASINLFRSGDLDLVWFGGLTGVQARLQVEGAQAIVQRDIDEAFHSVFIANTASGIRPVDAVGGLAQLKGKRFTYGSESSTSGRLMPEYFLDQAGVRSGDFSGPPGFSGSHDKTIALVESGTFEVGALNEQVWKSRTEAGQVDQSKVSLIFRTPTYHDYHWVLGSSAASRYGPGFVDKVSQAFLDLDGADPADKEILDLFGAKRFIKTDNGNYRQIEEVGRKAGLIS
ncbi:MAG: putative selenate ABC transporter substrate-binding protein [Acidimicrobiales bacterium]